MKGERIAQLELILRSHPEGLIRAEIARRLGVHRSTISRYLDDLSEHIDVYEENNLIKIKKKEDDENISLSVYELLAFNLSAEALLNSSEVQSPHLASGLRKIAMNMRSYAPKISDNMLVVAEKIDQDLKKNRNKNSQYSSILEVLIDAWVSGRMVKIQTTEQDLDEIELAPYFIGFREENQERQPISVTGRLRHTKEIITLDIGKIVSATLLNETYTIPDNLKPFKTLKDVDDYDAIDMIPLVLSLQEKSALNAFRDIVHGEVEYSKDENGKLICSFSAENSIELMMRIFQCGHSVQIISPNSYKTRYLNYLKDIISIYE